MKKLSKAWMITALIAVGCSDGFQTNMKFQKVTENGFSWSGGTTGGGSGGSIGGGTGGSSCTSGPRGSVPDLSSLVSQFYAQRGFLLAQDCQGVTNNYIGELVPFLRSQGHSRVGFNGDRAARDTITYLWDNGSCEGSANVSVIDVVGGLSECRNTNQYMVRGATGTFTLQPPPNSGTGGTSGGGTSGGTTGGTSGPGTPPNEYDLVKSIADSNPGMINDCNGFPVNNFLLTVVRALQQKDPRWGFMKKENPFRIPRDVVAYAWSSEREGTNNFFVIDMVASGCANWPGAPEYDDPAPDAGPAWQVTNPDGIANNGTWSFNP